MNKLIQISIKGSIYYSINPLSQNQITNLQKFAQEFYTSTPLYSRESDESILEQFVSTVHQTLGITLTIVPITTVLVIK